MSRTERVAWWIVRLIPQRLADWLMLSPISRRLLLPRSWVTYVFARALGVDGGKCKLEAQAPSQALPPGPPATA